MEKTLVLAVFGPFWLLQVLSSSSVLSDTVDVELATAQDVREACYRPAPPVRAWFESRHDFIQARETYYQEASAYVSVCIERWIAQTRQRYEEMYQAEVQGYLDERQSVMDEIRRVTIDE